MPKVDTEKCIGCGACVATCPEVFQLGEDSKSHVINAARCATCDCKAAADVCPVQAITLTEKKEEKKEKVAKKKK